jgi:DNA-binding IclR family transcriptional regulator
VTQHEIPYGVSPASVRSIERVARILDAFTVERPVLTLTECAEASRLTKSTAYRLLKTLEGVGLAERVGRSWGVGPKVVALATIRLDRIDVRREVLPRLRELRREFRAAVAFSVPEGSDMIYIERFDSPDAFGVSARLGARAPMWAGGSGKAVLARMDPEERELHLESPDWIALPQDSKRRVLDEIQAASLRGYAVDDGQFFDGIGGVAVAIRDRHDDPVGAMSVIFPRERLTDEFSTHVAYRLLQVVSEIESPSALSVSARDTSSIPSNRR